MALLHAVYDAAFGRAQGHVPALSSATPRMSPSNVSTTYFLSFGTSRGNNCCCAVSL